MTSLVRSALLSAMLVLGVVPRVSAITTSNWTHSSESDFTGKMESVVVSSRGELLLSRDIQKLVEQDPRFDVVYATLKLADGSIVFSTGPAGAIMKLSGGKLTQIYKPSDTSLASAMALLPDGKLLIGISGHNARLIQLDPDSGEAKDIFRATEAQFIWAIHVQADGSTILATGPNGQLLHVSPDGTSRVIVQLRQNNILSLLPLAEDMMVIGTDPDGLVIRINTKTGEWFVLYDAAEPEIVALASAPDGGIYAAGTSVVTEAAQAAAAAQAGPGRPEVAPDAPLHREPPAPPERPDDPGIDKSDRLPAMLRPQEQDEDGEDVDAAPVPPPVVEVAPSTAPSAGPALSPAPARPVEGSGGSAIYRISAGGFVSEVFRRNLTIHSMALSGNNLIVGTGPDGSIFEVRPNTEEVLMVARSASRQVSAMNVAPDGSVIIGVSNPGGVLQMQPGYANKGSYTSEPLDAEQVARFGMLQLQGTLPAGTSVTVAVRSGNVKDPDAGGWSKWSEEMPAAEFVQIAAPAARFFQYRLSLATKDAKVTPAIEEVKVNYLLPNMPPRVTSVGITPQASEANAAPSAHQIWWTASDPNNDELVYSLHYRLGHKGDWILLKDDLKETSFTWNTRQLSDGRYQVRVTASDAKANPAGEGLTGTRFSDPTIIDNTPPVIGDIKTSVEDGVVTVSLRVVDRTSTVAAVHFSVDAADDWQAAAASDMLYDSPDELVKFTTPKLAAGAHHIAIRARDSSGNAAYETLLIAVGK